MTLKSIIRGAGRFVGTVGLAALLTACPTNSSNVPKVDLVRPSNNAVVDSHNVGLEYRVSGFDADSCNTVLNGSIVSTDNNLSDGSSRLNNVSASSGLNSWNVDCDYDGNSVSSGSRNFVVSAICDSNPAVELAEEYNLPQSIVDSVSVLGNDCVVDDNDIKFISVLLPGILGRSNEQIALSYSERFIGDDGKFDEAENITMSRFLLGRYDREGLLVHPGYFELVDNGHVQIPNAYFMSIFELPFRTDLLPSGGGGKAEPIVSDNPITAFHNQFNLGRALEGTSIFDEGYTWIEAAGNNVSPRPNLCVSDLNYTSVQFNFNNNALTLSDRQREVVNPYPSPVEIIRLEYFFNANNVRNAHVTINPLNWPESLGHANTTLGLSHLDDQYLEMNDIRIGGIIESEGTIGYLDPDFEMWKLIVTYRSDEGIDFTDQDTGLYSPPTIDIYNPFPLEPEKRGLVWPVYYTDVEYDGKPITMNIGIHNNACNFSVSDELLWGNHPDVSPMFYTLPLDAISK